jgi:hypothetical protein
MAAGALSIVAPIAGAGAAIPVIWGLAHGDHPSGYQELGFAAALIGVVLASFERRPEAARLAAGVGWAVIAMLAFGAYYIPMHEASHGDFLWAAFVFRLTSTTLIAAAWLVAATFKCAPWRSPGSRLDRHPRHRRQCLLRRSVGERPRERRLDPRFSLPGCHGAARSCRLARAGSSLTRTRDRAGPGRDRPYLRWLTRNEQEPTPLS